MPVETETFTVKHPYNSPGHIALVEAFEDRKIVQHAGGPCVVLSRKTTGNAELVTSFELAYLASEQAERPGLMNTFNVTGLDDQARAKIVRGTPSCTQPDHRDRAIRWLVERLNCDYPIGLPWTTSKISSGWHVIGSDGDTLYSDDTRTEEIVAAVNAAHLRHDIGAFDVDEPSACASEPKAAPPPPLEQPEREPVAVVLGSADSLDPARVTSRVAVITHADATLWYTHDGCTIGRGGSSFALGISPATDAMLTAYFDPPQAEATAALQSAAAELRECGVALREADERNSSLRSERAKLEAAIKSFDVTLTDLTGHPRVSAELANDIEEALHSLRGALR